MKNYSSKEAQNARLVDYKGAREYHLHKNRTKKDKRMSLSEAISEYVWDGDIHAVTGFGYVRTPLQAYFEIIRQGKKDIVDMGAPMSTSSFFLHSRTAKALHLSYVGVEMRGNDKNLARAIKNKTTELYSLWSHGAMSLGFKAAQLGVPFIASKQMLSSQMIEHNPFVKTILNPLTSDDDPVCLIPALFPDITIIHVQQADRYGNAVIEGPAVNDLALAAASRRVIITAERIVPEMFIRENSTGSIPFWYADAVVELPYGAFPGCCPRYYYWDREWWEWVVRVGTPKKENVEDFFQHWIYGTKNPYDFIDKLGGMPKIEKARKLMQAAEANIDDSMVDFSYQEVIPKWD